MAILDQLVLSSVENIVKSIRHPTTRAKMSVDKFIDILRNQFLNSDVKLEDMVRSALSDSPVNVGSSGEAISRFILYTRSDYDWNSPGSKKDSVRGSVIYLHTINTWLKRIALNTMNGAMTNVKAKYTNEGDAITYTSQVYVHNLIFDNVTKQPVYSEGSTGVTNDYIASMIGLPDTGFTVVVVARIDYALSSGSRRMLLGVFSVDGQAPLNQSSITYAVWNYDQSGRPEQTPVEGGRLSDNTHIDTSVQRTVQEPATSDKGRMTLDLDAPHGGIVDDISAMLNKGANALIAEDSELMNSVKDEIGRLNVEFNAVLQSIVRSNNITQSDITDIDSKLDLMKHRASELLNEISSGTNMSKLYALQDKLKELWKYMNRSVAADISEEFRKLSEAVMNAGGLNVISQINAIKSQLNTFINEQVNAAKIQLRQRAA